MFNLFKRQVKKITEEDVKLEVIKGVVDRMLTGEFKRIKDKHEELKHYETALNAQRKENFSIKTGNIKNGAEIREEEVRIDAEMHKNLRNTQQKNDNYALKAREYKAQLNLIKWLKKS